MRYCPAVTQTRRQLTRPILLVLATVWTVGAQGTTVARAENPPPQPLACAVDWSHGEPTAAAVCDAVARELARPVKRVEDARKVRTGDSLQVLDGDVDWTLVWLRAGRVRVWTRVSKALA